MSRSIRKIPKFGLVSSDSEKKDKSSANRKLRRKNKVNVKLGKTSIEKRENSNVWAFGKDGKKYRKNVDKKYLRK